MKQMDTAGVRLHMRFEKPFPSAQGMAIWGDWAFHPRNPCRSFPEG